MGINPRWRMHRVSDGQRRRVQICLGLLREFRVLLLDEVTVDLDVLARAALMRFLRDECETRGTTVVYCTHIFDGLEGWPTHLAYVAGGRLRLFGAVGDIPELNRGARLMDVVLEWLREGEGAARVAMGCWDWQSGCGDGPVMRPVCREEGEGRGEEEWGARCGGAGGAGAVEQWLLIGDPECLNQAGIERRVARVGGGPSVSSKHKSEPSLPVEAL